MSWEAGAEHVVRRSLMAQRMQLEMDRAGWRGKMEVYYRDGSRVDWAAKLQEGSV